MDFSFPFLGGISPAALTVSCLAPALTTFSARLFLNDHDEVHLPPFPLPLLFLSA